MKLNIGQYIYSALSAIVVAPAATANDTPQLLTAFPVIADFNNTANLAESVANALIGLSHQVKAGIKFNQVLLTDLSEDFIEGIYTQTLQFEINTTEI